MGCCRSLLSFCSLRLQRLNAAHVSASFTQTEILELGALLSEMPSQCQEVILNLPARRLLNLYQCHTMALHHGLKREWLRAISCEQRVIKGLQALLPTQKDHYIFSSFYNVLSASFLALGEFQTAIEGIRIALAIIIKHTPMDYRTISSHYYHLAHVYNIVPDRSAALHSLTKAIEMAKLNDPIDQTYVYMLENELQDLKLQMPIENLLNVPCST